MPKENNKMQVDIDTLKKQNVNDLLSIKELYRKLKEVEEKISQIKYIDSTLAKKLQKEYEKLVKIILEENIQLKLTNDIETINSKLDTKANGEFFRTSNKGIQSNVVCGSPYNRVEDLPQYQGNTISGGGVEEWSANVIGGNCDAVKKPDGSKAYPNNYRINDDDQACGMNVITGGYDNVCNGLANMITGHHNYTRHPSNHSVISGGTFNKLEYGACQVIAGGSNNQIDSTSKLTNGQADQNTISGGGDNLINDSQSSTISGGNSNKINKNANSVISGGSSNTIDSTTGIANTNVILGGSSNLIKSSNCSIVGGYKNTINEQHSVILGGYQNTANKTRSVVCGYMAKGDIQDSVTFGINTTNGIIKQNVKLSLYRTTTNNTKVPLLIPIRPNSINAINGTLVGLSSNGTAATFFIKGSIKCGSDGKTYTKIGTPIIDSMLGTGAESWKVEVDCNYNSPYIFVNITGDSTKIINWFLDVDLTELVLD